MCYFTYEPTYCTGYFEGVTSQSGTEGPTVVVTAAARRSAHGAAMAPTGACTCSLYIHIGPRWRRDLEGWMAWMDDRMDGWMIGDGDGDVREGCESCKIK